MIKKIENGDVKQVAGGQIKQVLILPHKRTRCSRQRRLDDSPNNFSYIVVDANGKQLTPVLNAQDAKEAEVLLLGDKANSNQYTALTGKMVDF